MIPGISYRNKWDDSTDALDLNRFPVIELVPFMDFDSQSKIEAAKQVDRWGKKRLWMHLTTISTADTPEYFRTRVESIADVLADESVEGISLHYGLQHSKDRYLIQPFPTPDEKTIVDNSLANMDTLRSLFGNKRIAVENISCGIDYSSNSGRSYVDTWCDFLTQSGQEQLLDLTNLWNTAKNTGKPFQELLDQALLAAPVAYYHIGGSFEFRGKWLDSHDRFIIDQEVQNALNQLKSDEIVIYEHDFDLQNVTFIKQQMDAFFETITNH
jgi:uncharacterized protein (UPF0276 family)